ncbi:GyrI-like domain-containing protein [Ancylobacter mangrovi]|uniref:GyrI-like domain-containing protein n=1 Tax=Ancylobacter mangrovi TaxID=2972472 RepID=UPI002162287A|nr:GyrI-like domain-containing protein [Ancylobacter mangrovi]MCS0504903.1 GyrI-like domain-containing protein [Ancylobacter mangrovi]
MSMIPPPVRLLLARLALLPVLLAPALPLHAQAPDTQPGDADSMVQPDEGAADTGTADKGADAPTGGSMVAPPVVDPKAVETQAVPLGGDPLKRPDSFGDLAMMQPVPVLAKQGYSDWDEGFDTIVATLKQIYAEMDRLKLKPSGAAFILYTSTDDNGFRFEAEVPFTGATTEKPKEGFDFSASPAGKALRFTHRGPYDAMDPTYEQIANLLDAKDLEAQDLYIEEYRSDPRTTSQDDLVIDIWVPLK